jgi:hypothetical protein
MSTKKREQAELLDTDDLDQDEEEGAASAQSPSEDTSKNLVARLSRRSDGGKPLDEADLQARLERHPKDGKLPSLERPGTAPPSPSATVVDTNPDGERYAPVNLKIQVPLYVQDWLDQQAKARGSKRWHILRALKAIGCPVEEADLYEDGRRIRGSARDRMR